METSSNHESYYSHPTAIVDERATVGTNTKIWHFCHISDEASIGDECTLGQNVFIDRNVHIGNKVKIQNNVSVYQGVTLQNGVFCGPSVVFTNVNRPRSYFPREESEYQKTLVQTGVTIGANATIICGHKISQWAFIGAGAVVTHDLPEYSLVMGNPAKQVGWACECGTLHKQLEGFTEWSCPNCERSYRLRDQQLIPEHTPFTYQNG